MDPAPPASARETCSGRDGAVNAQRVTRCEAPGDGLKGHAQTRTAPGAAAPPSPSGCQFGPHTLREYALLADGERGALIGPRGDVAWMCAPSWDDDAVFSSLIGGRGHFSVTPSGRFVWGGHYEDHGLIWRSRWVTETSDRGMP